MPHVTAVDSVAGSGSPDLDSILENSKQDLSYDELLLHQGLLDTEYNRWKVDYEAICQKRDEYSDRRNDQLHAEITRLSVKVSELKVLSKSLYQMLLLIL